MKKHNTAKLEDLLNHDQIKKLTRLAGEGNIMSSESRKKILDIINEDDSKWKEVLIPSYFGYAIQHALNSPVVRKLDKHTNINKHKDANSEDK